MISTIFEEAQFHSSNFCLTEQLGTPCYVFEEQKSESNIVADYINEMSMLPLATDITDDMIQVANDMLKSFVSEDISVPRFSPFDANPSEYIAWIRAYCK